MAKHWLHIGAKGRKELVEKLRQRAKDIPILSADAQNNAYLFGAEQYFAFEQAYSGDFGGSAFGHDEASRFYAGHFGGLSRGTFLNYNCLPSDEMAQVFAAQVHSSLQGQPASTATGLVPSSKSAH